MCTCDCIHHHSFPSSLIEKLLLPIIMARAGISSHASMLLFLCFFWYAFFVCSNFCTLVLIILHLFTYKLHQYCNHIRPIHVLRYTTICMRIMITPTSNNDSMSDLINTFLDNAELTKSNSLTHILDFDHEDEYNMTFLNQFKLLTIIQKQTLLKVLRTPVRL